MSLLFPKNRPYTFSSLTDNQWRHFFQNGFYIVKGLLSQTEITKTRQSLQQLNDIAKKLATQYPSFYEGDVHYKGAKFVFKNNRHAELERLYRVCGCGSIDPVLLHTSRHPKLLTIFQDLLMTRRMEHLICQFHAKSPGDNVAYPPHRDIEFRVNNDPLWQDVNQWGSYVVAVIAIDQASVENGGLYLVPGSHNECKLNTLTPARKPFDPRWGIHALCPTLNAGDALLMHPYLVHWSNPNTSDEPRFSLLSGVCCPEANHVSYPGNCMNEIIPIHNDPQ